MEEPVIFSYSIASAPNFNKLQADKTPKIVLNRLRQAALANAHNLIGGI
jgi:hypothetical protein